MTMSGMSDLDSLIHSLEFENQQYVKMIEKENQRIEYLETEEEKRTSAINELQVQITNLELDTKQNHRQFVHNKNTIESQKKTKCVLQAHIEALHKQLEVLQMELNEQQCEFNSTLKMYEKTWTEYDAQYRSLPLYKALVEARDKLQQSEAQRSSWQKQKLQLQRKMQAAQEEQDFRNWQRFCFKIAEKKLSNEGKKRELLAVVKVMEKDNLPSTCQTTQTMETNDTDRDPPDREASEERNGDTVASSDTDTVTGSDTEAVTSSSVKEPGGGGDGDGGHGAGRVQQKYHFLYLFLLHLSLVVLTWVCRRHDDFGPSSHRFLCPLHTY